MFSSTKKILLAALYSVSLALISNSTFADDTLWKSTFAENVDWRVDMEAHEDHIYWVDYRNCDVTYCTTTLTKMSKDGDLQWEITSEYFSEEEVPSLEVNQHGIFVAVYQHLVKFNFDGEMEWVIDLALELDPLLNTARFTTRDITSDESGVYLSLSVRSDNGDRTFAYAALDFDGQVNWATPSNIVTGQSSNYFGAVGTLVINNGVLYSGAEGAMELVSTLGNILAVKTYNPAKMQKFNKLVVGNTGIFAYGEYNNGVSGKSNHYVLYKLDFEGAMEWANPYFVDSKYTIVLSSGYEVFPSISGLAVIEDDFFIGGRRGNDLDEQESTIGKYSSDGTLALEQTLDLPENVFVTGLTVDESRFFSWAGESDFNQNWLNGAAEIAFSGSTVDIEETDSTPTKAFALGDINNDGYQDIGLILENNVFPGFTVKSIGESTDFDAFNLNTPIAPNLKVISDQNNNGSVEIAYIVDGTAEVLLQDSLTGEVLNTYDFNQFNSDFKPSNLKFYPDINGNGSLEVALVGYFDNRRNSKAVVIKDTATNELMHTVYFNPNFTPKDLALVDDIDGDTRPEIAVFSTDRDNNSKFEIRSLQGQVIKNIWLGNSYNSTQLITLPVAINNEPTLATALGALQTKVNGNGLTVRVMDVESGAEIQSVNYNSNFNPVTAKAISDINANATPEIAVLGSNTNSSTGETSTKIEVKDSHSGNLVKNVWQNKTVTPIDLTIVADINGNGSPETVTLVEQNDSYKAIVKDSLTGELLDTVVIETD